MGRRWRLALRKGCVGEIGPNEGGDEPLLVGAENARGEVNKMGEGDVTVWLSCEGLSYKTCRVVAVTGPWTERTPYASLSTKAFVRTVWFVADV